MRQQATLIFQIATVIASLSLLAPQARAWTLQNLEVSKVKPSTTSCTPPTAALAFAPTDSYIYEYFVVQGIKAGDQVSIRWITPSSGYYPQSWGTVTAAGNYCFTGGSLTNAQFLPYPGGWWLEVYVNNQYQSHTPFTVLAPQTVLTQSPSQLNMSTGDTSKTITTNLTPTTNYQPAFSSNLQSNPNSSCQAGLGFSPGSGSGSVNTTVKASPAGCSGVFSAVAKSGSTTSNNSTRVVVPPQILVQMLYGEAHGQASNGDNISQLAIGVATRNRFSQSGLFSGVTTYQAAITSNQFAGIATGITNGPIPDINNAAAVFTSTDGVSVANAACFFSPTASGWKLIQGALNSRTLTIPSVTYDTGCYGTNRQFVVKTSVGNNINGSGAPAFIFEQRRNPASDPAVIQIP